MRSSRDGTTMEVEGEEHVYFPLPNFWTGGAAQNLPASTALASCSARPAETRPSELRSIMRVRSGDEGRRQHGLVRRGRTSLSSSMPRSSSIQVALSSLFASDFTTSTALQV